MSIETELDSELKDAMRARDVRRTAVIRQIKTEVSVAASASGFDGDIDDDLYTDTIASYVKKMKKAKAEFESAGERGRERADQLAFEIDYLSRWLPAQLSEAETQQLVVDTIADLGVGEPKDAGRVVGHIMKSGAAVDGGVVNRLVREALDR